MRPDPLLHIVNNPSEERELVPLGVIGCEQLDRRRSLATDALKHALQVLLVRLVNDMHSRKPTVTEHMQLLDTM